MCVFICYSSADSEVAGAFYDMLVAHSVPAWMDRVDILPGENWQDSIDRAVRCCTHVVVLLSQNAVASDDVEAEWALGKDLGKTIVPVLIEAVDVPYRLRQHQHIPFSDGQIAAQVGRLLPVLPRLDLPRITSEPLPRQASPDDYAQFRLCVVENHEGTSISANPRQFATLGTLLNELFTHTMGNFVAPYSYGAEWLIIGDPFSKSVIAPIEWVENPGRPTSAIAPDWVVSMRPAESWIVPRSHWEIVVREPKGRGGLNSMEYIKARAYGVVTNNDRVAAALKMNAKAIAFLRKRFRTGTVAAAKNSGYRHSLVFSDWLNTGLVGKIAIDSNEELSDDIERFLRW